MATRDYPGQEKEENAARASKPWRILGENGQPIVAARENSMSGRTTPNLKTPFLGYNIRLSPLLMDGGER